MRSEDELIEAADARKYFVGVATVADEHEQVVRPAQYFDPEGCFAVRVEEDGVLVEGWWSPHRAFRPFE